MQLLENDHGFARVNLYEQIADFIERKILLGDDPVFSEGKKLPPEQDLANYFGVSRNVIRESIKLLKERGLVDPRNGVGAYVTRPDESKISTMMYRYILLRNVDPDSIYDVRSLLEPVCARMAAEKVTDEELRHMDELLAHMEDRSIAIKERRETDFAFHVEIARATRNAMMEMLVTAMKDIIIAMMEKGIMVYGGIDDASFHHKRILNALRAHDPQLAEEMMRAHVEQSRLQVKKYDDGLKIEEDQG